jgi:hypothetical protein
MKAKSLHAAVLLSLASCLPGGLNLKPGPIKLYEGPNQPAESLAVIENDPNMFLVSVDSQSLRRWTQSHDILTIHVLPGRRIIVAGPSVRAGFVSMDAARIEFVAEPGHRYVVSRRVVGGSRSTEWTAVFTDVTTGKELLP